MRQGARVGCSNQARAGAAQPSMLDSFANRANAACSSRTGGAAANATDIGCIAQRRRCARCLDERALEVTPASRVRIDERRAERPLVDLGRSEQLIERRRYRERRSGRVSIARRSHRLRAIRPAAMPRAHARRGCASRRATSHRLRPRASPGLRRSNAKNRLLPVRRRELSNGNAAGSLSRRPPARGECHVRRAADLRGSSAVAARQLGSEIVGDGAGAAARAWRLRRAGRTELRDLLPRARQRIGEDQQQVARLAHVQRGVDRFLLVGDDRDLLASTRLRPSAPWR